MERLFIDDLEYSKEIVLAEFRKRPVNERLFERACHLVWPVL